MDTISLTLSLIFTKSDANPPKYFVKHMGEKKKKKKKDLECP